MENRQTKNFYEGIINRRTPYNASFYVLLGALALVYIWCRTHGINFGDAIVFVTGVNAGWCTETNATNHWLYTNTLSTLLPLWPWNPLEDKLVFVSIIFGVLSLWQAYRFAYLLSGSERGSLLAMLLMALGFTWWRQAEIIEVYTAGTFLLFLTLIPLCRDLLNADDFFKKPGSSPFSAAFWQQIIAGFNTGPNPAFRHVYLVSFMYGMAILLHIQHVLMMPVFIWYLYRSGGTRALKGLALFIATSSILWLSPLIWHQNTIGQVFFDIHYSRKWLIPPIGVMLKLGRDGIFYFIWNYGFFIPIIAWGVWLAWQHRRETTLLLMYMVAVYSAYCLRNPVADAYVFYLVPNVLLAVLASFAYGRLTKNVSENLVWGLYILQGLSLPLMYYSAYYFAKDTPKLAYLGERKAYKGGVRYLMLPWMNNLPDLIYTSRVIYERRIVPVNFIEFHWNYVPCIQYLYGHPDPTEYEFTKEEGNEKVIKPLLPEYKPTGYPDSVFNLQPVEQLPGAGN
ncbi:MAG: hypothetical protein V4543_02285 [Bacteroidota bacterium]